MFSFFSGADGVFFDTKIHIDENVLNVVCWWLLNCLCFLRKSYLMVACCVKCCYFLERSCYWLFVTLNNLTQRTCSRACFGIELPMFLRGNKIPQKPKFKYKYIFHNKFVSSLNWLDFRFIFSEKQISWCLLSYFKLFLHRNDHRLCRCPLLKTPKLYTFCRNILLHCNVMELGDKQTSQFSNIL